MAETENVPVKVRRDRRTIWSARERPNAREVIAAAAARLGGEEALVAWVRRHPRNERLFWASIFPRLMALEVKVDVSSRIAHVIFKGLNDDRE